MAKKKKSKAVVVEEGQPDDNQLRKEQLEEEGIVDPEIDFGDEGQIPEEGEDPKEYGDQEQLQDEQSEEGMDEPGIDYVGSLPEESPGEELIIEKKDILPTQWENGLDREEKEEEPVSENDTVPEIESDQHSEDEEGRPALDEFLPEDEVKEHADYLTHLEDDDEGPESEEEPIPEEDSSEAYRERMGFPEDAVREGLEVLDAQVKAAITEIRAVTTGLKADIVEMKAALKGLAAAALSVEEYNCYQINFPRLFRE